MRLALVAVHVLSQDCDAGKRYEHYGLAVVHNKQATAKGKTMLS